MEVRRRDLDAEKRIAALAAEQCIEDGDLIIERRGEPLKVSTHGRAQSSGRRATKS